MLPGKDALFRNGGWAVCSNPECRALDGGRVCWVFVESEDPPFWAWEQVPEPELEGRARLSPAELHLIYDGLTDPLTPG